MVNFEREGTTRIPYIWLVVVGVAREGIGRQPLPAASQIVSVEVLDVRKQDKMNSQHCRHTKKICFVIILLKTPSIISKPITMLSLSLSIYISLNLVRILL